MDTRTSQKQLSSKMKAIKAGVWFPHKYNTFHIKQLFPKLIFMKSPRDRFHWGLCCCLDVDDDWLVFKFCLLTNFLGYLIKYFLPASCTINQRTKSAKLVPLPEMNLDPNVIQLRLTTLQGHYLRSDHDTGQHLSPALQRSQNISLIRSGQVIDVGQSKTSPSPVVFELNEYGLYNVLYPRAVSTCWLDADLMLARCWLDPEVK